VEPHSLLSMALPQVLTDALASGEAINGDGNVVAFRYHISLADAEGLYGLVRTIRPEHSIEVGLGMGASALAITQALEDNGGAATHHIVDPFQDDYQNVGVKCLERAGLMHRVEFHAAFPEEVVPRLPGAQFAFIDGSHLFDLTILDFVLIDKRLSLGGTIGFDDAPIANVQKALRYIVLNRSYSPIRPISLPRAQRARVLISRVASKIPRAERVLRSEILRPAAAIGTAGSRVVYLEKNATDDSRHWRDGIVGF
jgi:hypothetical protein